MFHAADQLGPVYSQPRTIRHGGARISPDNLSVSGSCAVEELTKGRGMHLTSVESNNQEELDWADGIMRWVTKSINMDLVGLC